MFVVSYAYVENDYYNNDMRILPLDMKRFFSHELSDDEIKPYINDISYLKIFNLEATSYISNLYKLDNLKELMISKTGNMDIYEQLPKLKSLKILYITEINNKMSKYIIKNIKKCKNIEYLRLVLDIDYFPCSMMKLKKLNEFSLNSSIIDHVFNDIPNKIIKKNKLLTSFNINTDIEFLIHKNKIFIINPAFFDYKTIPKNIRFIQLNNEYEMNKLKNLPKYIKQIYVRRIIIHKRIWNLPPSLDKIETECMYYLSRIKLHKLPYGCLINEN